ncbi:MAG: HD domain-containing protein [Bryobacteraceae bacterium]|jgi:3'-5' exoribonuclease
MKSPFVSELDPSKVATATFLVHAKEIRQKKTGEPYLSLVLGDRTGELDAKMWDNVAEVMDTFARDDFVRVKGLLQIYNNRPQLIIHKLQRLDDAAVDPTDFFPASRRNPQEMLEELRQVVRSVENPHLRALLELFLSDEEIVRRYVRAPAAKFIHHAYLGGLIEHVLSVCGLCRLAAGHFPGVDLDLLLAGAILHDIGKIHELTYERGFGYTSEGQLLGHIFIGVRMIEEKLAQLPDFPPRLRTLVQHLVVSHHGSLQFGSPKVPLFPEALLLHYLDDLDSKMECMRALVEQDRQVEGHWTGYNSALERVVLKKLKYLGGGAEPDADPANGPAAGVSLPLVAAQPEREGGGAIASPPELARLPGRPASRPPQPSTPSLFGEKLGQALRGEE